MKFHENCPPPEMKSWLRPWVNVCYSIHTLAKLALKETVPSEPRTSPHVTDTYVPQCMYPPQMHPTLTLGPFPLTTFSVWVGILNSSRVRGRMKRDCQMQKFI